MRKALIFVGIGALVIIVGSLINWHFTPKKYDQATGDAASSTSSMTTLTLSIKSSAFASNAPIPSKYTCDGDQVSPPLEISGVPDGTRSLVLIVEDPDVPRQLKADGIFDHWVLFNIPANTALIAEGASVGVPGNNGAGVPAYTGPCPPAQYEPNTHRYMFKLYALDGLLGLQEGASKSEVVKAMQQHIMEEAQLVGTYKKR
jgi:Raf kinase inhibitor-like YbhB/YbcL family protein